MKPLYQNHEANDSAKYLNSLKPMLLELELFWIENFIPFPQLKHVSAVIATIVCSLSRRQSKLRQQFRCSTHFLLGEVFLDRLRPLSAFG